MIGPDAESGGAVERLRIAKWLWHARFFKTRSLAARVVEETPIRLNGQLVAKAHQPVRPGDVLTFSQGRQVRVIKVVALGVRRGPAPEARALYEDLAPPSPETAMPLVPDTAGRRDRGAGRPTKRERRRIDSLIEPD